MSREDFSTWFIHKPNWKDIAYDYNTGKAYQHKQDLVAVFWNSYLDYEKKFEDYFDEFNVIPTDFFNDLIFEFRQKFPKSGRIEGINYFDDHIEMLINKYDTMAVEENEIFYKIFKKEKYPNCIDEVSNFNPEYLRKKMLQLISDETTRHEVLEMLPGSEGNRHDGIKDTYCEFEKRYLYYQIKSCELILRFKPNDIIVKKYKKYLQTILNEINSKTQISDLNWDEMIANINNALFRLEGFMNRSIDEYRYFGFNDAFTELLHAIKNPENFTGVNRNLVLDYFSLLDQHRVDFDKGDYNNDHAHDNEDFERDSEEISYLAWERGNQFGDLLTASEIYESEKKLSITDISPGGHVLPSNNTEKDFELLKNSENQFWKGIPIDMVISHFEIMTTRKSSNGTSFLTKLQLHSFLKRAFLKDASQPIQKINLSNAEKGFVIKRFYEFFDLSVSSYGELNKKAKYINLISDNFDNWERESIISYFKPKKTKREW